MPREYMIRRRESLRLSQRDMAIKCKCSVVIITMLEEEDDSVTHPNIAERIAKVYNLTPSQATSLIPKNYRPGTPEYDPDYYKRLEDGFEYRDFVINV